MVENTYSNWNKSTSQRIFPCSMSESSRKLSYLFRIFTVSESKANSCFSAGIYSWHQTDILSLEKKLIYLHYSIMFSAAEWKSLVELIRPGIKFTSGPSEFSTESSGWTIPEIFEDSWADSRALLFPLLDTEKKAPNEQRLSRSYSFQTECSVPPAWRHTSCRGWKTPTDL